MNELVYILNQNQDNTPRGSDEHDGCIELDKDELAQQEISADFHRIILAIGYSAYG